MQPLVAGCKLKCIASILTLCYNCFRVKKQKSYTERGKNMNIEIANKLLSLRKKSGLSQEELAEKLGISRQAISKWERAEASPDTDNLIALAKIYNISLDKLFEIDVLNTITVDKVKSERSHISLRKDEYKSDKMPYQEDKMPDGFKSKTSDNIGMRIKYPEGKSQNVKEIYPQKQKEDSAGKTDSSQSDKVESESAQSHSSCNYNYNYNYSYKEPEQKSTFNYETVPDQGPSYQASVVPENNGIYKLLMTFPYPIVITGLYLLAGAFLNLWHPAWMIFLTIPLYYTTIEAVKKKDLNIFCFPVLVVFFYLAIGFMFNLWHPGWISFMSVPFYYWLVNINKNAKIK